MTCFVAVANRGEITTILVCCLYSTALIFHALEMVQYWFQAKLLSKHSSLAMLCAHIVVSAYKIWLLVSGKSVYWFALSHAVEYGVTGLILIITYKKQGTQKLSISWKIAVILLKKSRHYITAMLMVVVFSRIGGILLTLFSGEAENGFLATASTCVWITTFVFHAIFDTTRPVILESKHRNQLDYEKNVSRVYCLTTWLSIAQSVFFTLFAGTVVKILYGDAYLPAVPVLRILCWQSAFSYMGYVRNIWILAEEKHQVLWKINLSGAIFNIAVNVILIPLWGACGAALASVLTQFFTNFIMGFILKPIRENNRLLLKGMDPRLVWDMAKMLLQKRGCC
jgi:O-antigen/teichoic acid export membrane protein